MGLNNEFTRGKVKLANKGNTKVLAGNDGFTSVVLHGTPVVKFNAEKIVLNSGGWRTVTTLQRMNQAAQEFGLKFRVFQKKYKWFVAFLDAASGTFEGNKDFEDGLVLARGEHGV